MPSSCLGPALCFLLHTSRHILSCYPHPLRFNVMSVDLYTLYSFHFQLTPLHLHLHFLQSPVVPSPLLSPCPLCLLSSQVGSIGCYHVTPKPGFHFHVFIFIYHCHATCFFRKWSCNVGVCLCTWTICCSYIVDDVIWSTLLYKVAYSWGKMETFYY